MEKCWDCGGDMKVLDKGEMLVECIFCGKIEEFKPSRLNTEGKDSNHAEISIKDKTSYHIKQNA